MIPLRVFVSIFLCLAAAFSAPGVVKVACIGDSITEGTGLANPSLESYVAKLQRLLGTNYMVRNFGVSGRTMLRQGDFPYWKESAFTQSHSFEPDIVTILLGTNDGKPFNWKYGTNFLSDYVDFIASYAALASHPRIIVFVPPPVFGAGGYSISPGIIATNVVPLVREIGREQNLQTVDIYQMLIDQKPLFPDTVHPGTKGTTVMASIFFDALTRTNGPAATPQLSSTQITPIRVVLQWPPESGAWVLQSANALRGTNTVWAIIDQPAVNNEASLRVTNAIPALGTKFYRLWNPTVF